MSRINKKDHAFFSFKDFSKLDNSQNLKYLVSSMDAMVQIAGVRQAKDTLFNFLNLKKNETVIEFGCGLGRDAEMAAEKVGMYGKVVALDASACMIQEAARRSTHPQVVYKQEVINNLTIEGAFDAAYADRVLVSQKNPEKIFKKMVAIVKPYGRISINDLDYGTMAFFPFSPSVTPKIIERLIDITENPFIGRTLPHLFKQAKLNHIKIATTAYHINQLSLFNEAIVNIEYILNDLVALQKITDKESQRYHVQLQKADKQKTFLYTVTHFTVCGSKEE